MDADHQAAGQGGLTAAGFTVRPVGLAATRALRRSVLRPHESLAELAARERADAYSVAAFDDGDDSPEPVAVGMILPDGGPGAWRVRGMATAPHARGRGAGSAVLTALLAHARAQGARTIWCNARTPALSLYRRAGFEVVSAEFELPRIGPHRRLELRLQRGGDGDPA